MDYTDIALFGLGILGVFLHNLVELNKLNKATDGNAKLHEYLKTEVYSIIIAVIAFVTIGYMGQSLLIAFMGRAKSKIEK